jgi:hypothetical protein
MCLASPYQVRSAMTHRDLGVVSDRDWTQGISVSFEPLQKVEILEVRMER